MTTTVQAVRLDLLTIHASRVTRIELIDGPGRVDTCDCHGWAWPANVISYVPGPDTFECPLALP